MLALFLWKNSVTYDCDCDCDDTDGDNCGATDATDDGGDCDDLNVKINADDDDGGRKCSVNKGDWAAASSS